MESPILHLCVKVLAEAQTNSYLGNLLDFGGETPANSSFSL